MVKYLSDPTGRFNSRSFYTENEIDSEFETLVHAFFAERLKRPISYPLDTEDLIRLIEEKTSDFDQYADLSEDGPDVEGVTRFKRKQKPEVAISARLSEDNRRSNRFRTTLAHELAHAHLHDHLYQETVAQPDLWKSERTLHKVVCHRDSITDAKTSDWLEWQACYASGAVLMPRRVVRSAMADFAREHGLKGGAVWTKDALAKGAIETVRDRFQVSFEAASVRLRVLGHLTKDKPQPALF
jgi:Zn-dependent peptidase ImmA (M78 family)